MTSFDPFNPARGAEPGAVLIGWRPAPVRRRGVRRLHFVQFWRFVDAVLRVFQTRHPATSERFSPDVTEPLQEPYGDIAYLHPGLIRVLHAHKHGENGCKNFYPQDKSFTFVHGVRG